MTGTIANEAATDEAGAVPYFSALIEHVKQIDRTRPVTVATNLPCAADKVAPLLDFVSLNRCKQATVRLSSLQAPVAHPHRAETRTLSQCQTTAGTSRDPA